ncbi:MAG: helix-turn-helix transcriptional regulator [Mediterraneibacter sp.]
MELGTQIRKYRNERTLSQEALAEKVYVSRQTVSNWENDKSYPDVNSLVLLSEVFEISLDQLIKVEEKAERNEERPVEQTARKYDRLRQ